MEFRKSTGSDRWVISPWYGATFASACGPTGNLMVDPCDAIKAAVKRFQATHPPLKVDGWAGVQTCATLAIELEKLKGNDE
jgi:hypothetical protein